jgi:hypothetical protein
MNMDCYRERIAEIGKQLQEKTLGEIKTQVEINKFNYIGVGFGYNLKDSYPDTMENALKSTLTPEFDELVTMSKAI